MKNKAVKGILFCGLLLTCMAVFSEYQGQDGPCCAPYRRVCKNQYNRDTKRCDKISGAARAVCYQISKETYDLCMFETAFELCDDCMEQTMGGGGGGHDPFEPIMI